jgi:hypothetical protein
MSIETYGTGGRLRAAERLAPRLGASHLVLLPVPTSKDKKHVTNTDILLSDTLCNVEEGSCVVGYGLPDWYKKVLDSSGAHALDLLEDEEFLAENAEITAIGALGYILTTEKRIPHDTRFGVVGYGRIGSRIVRMLLFHGARVKVYTSKALTCFELGMCGIDCVSVSEWNGSVYDFSDIDVLINTAPNDMKQSFPGGKIPSGMRVLELASGENFSGVIGVEKLPALPDRMYPESAGLSYYNAIKRFIEKNG